MSFRLLLLYHGLCLALLEVSAHTVELNEMFGQIQSPGYPDSYPSDSEVTWNITVPEGFRIKLYFMHFNLESSYLCEYDYVKVGPQCSLTGHRPGTTLTLAGMHRVRGTHKETVP